MDKTSKKVIMVCMSLSILCMILYFIFIPHITSTNYFSNDTIEKIETVIPLTKTEIIINEIKIFIFVNIPSIFILLKYLVKKIVRVEE